MNTLENIIDHVNYVTAMLEYKAIVTLYSVLGVIAGSIQDTLVDWLNYRFPIVEDDAPYGWSHIEGNTQQR